MGGITFAELRLEHQPVWADERYWYDDTDQQPPYAGVMVGQEWRDDENDAIVAD